jgi:SOUL heme-binding protein
MRKRNMLLIIAGVVVIGAAAWGPIMSNVEQAKYKVLSKYGAFEIREYEPHIVAKVSVEGEREYAINTGFKMIADYIFGNNKENIKVDMTTPVMQQQNSEKWNVQFVMPEQHSLGTLPTPNNDSVKLQEIGIKTYGVIRFSGIIDQNTIKYNTDELHGFLKSEKLISQAPAIYAFYNPPWTLPFLRRNEVMLEITQ